MIIKYHLTGGPLITEEDDGQFTLVGVLHGGGIDCSQLGNLNYTGEDQTGHWMRVGSFERWIRSIIFRETNPGETRKDYNWQYWL